MEHLKVCRAKGTQTNKCGMRGHFGKVCRRVRNQSQQKPPPRRVNWVEEEGEEQKTEEDDTSDEQYVLGIDRGRSPPSIMKGKINRKKWAANI